MGLVRATVTVPKFNGEVATGRSSIKTIVSRVRNEPVLAALQRISGKDFGYDQEAWLTWWERAGQALTLQQDRVRGRVDRSATDQKLPVKIAQERKERASGE